MKGSDVLMKIMEPQRQVEPPHARLAIQQERNVVPLLLDEPGGAAVTTFVPIVEADHPRKLHDS
jgi:hypothetical protein